MSIFFGHQVNEYYCKRVSVVPYVVSDEGSIIFLLGLDRMYNEITDMGGTVKPKEKPLDAGNREFSEESKEIFKTELTKKELASCVSVYYNFEVTIFAPVDLTRINNAENLFNNSSFKEKCKNEILKIMWIDNSVFKTLIYGGNYEGYYLWSKLRKYYKKVYSPNLEQLLILRWNWFGIRHIVNTKISVSIKS